MDEPAQAKRGPEEGGVEEAKADDQEANDDSPTKLPGDA